MPIQVIDNFDINTSKPLDNRFVVGPNSFYLTRHDIQWKYDGLRIWDINDSQPYVYNGITWSTETSSNIQGVGDAGYITKFSLSNQISNSVIFESSGNILIGATISYPFSPTGKLQVNGIIRSITGGFYGDGTNLTSLNASNILTGSLDLARLSISGSSVGNVMVRNTSSATWQSASSLVVGTASALAATRTLWGQNFNGTSNVSGNITVNGSVLAITGAVQFKNSNNGLLNVVYGGTSNINRTFTIPSSNSMQPNRTFALLEQTQTFTGINTFDNFTFLNDNIQVTGTSSFFDEMRVFVTKILPVFGFNVPVTSNPLNVLWGGISIGATTSNGSPYIRVDGGYTWYGDNDTAMQRLSPSLGSTQGCILFKANDRTQMVLGQGVTPGYVHSSTAGETYSTAAIALLITPGVSLMGIISNWDITFGGATINQTRWLNTLQDGLFTSLTAVGIPFSIGGFKFDTTLSISCGRNAIVICYLELVLGSGVFTEVARIDFAGCFNFIIPAGRKWRVSLTSSPSNVYFSSSSSFDAATFTLYKYGMS